MKQIYSCLLIFLSVTAVAQNKVDTLENETIIKLSKSKLSPNVISQKIDQSVCNFDVSVDALIKLKENDVDDNVIDLMVSKQSKTGVAPNQVFNDKEFSFTESGIYFLKNEGYINLDPTVVTTTTPKAGFITLKYKSQIEGSEANYQLDNKRPEFYFNFKTATTSLNDPNANSTLARGNYFDQLFCRTEYGYNTYQAISPNDFKLIKLEKGKSKREFVSGKVGGFTHDMSIDGKSIVNFKYEKLSATTFKIKFDKDLSPGEYCFIYLGNTNNAANPQNPVQNNMKLFDFGIAE